MTFAMQDLINAAGENDFSAKDIKHCYLQLMNLTSKDIRDVDTVFSVSVEDRTSKSGGFVSRQQAVAPGKKDLGHFCLSPVQPNEDCKADRSQDEAWTKRHDDTLVRCFAF